MDRNKFLTLILILGILSKSLSAKNSLVNDSVVTIKNYTFFCDSIVKNDPVLSLNEIYFSGVANILRSDLYHVVDCLGDISLIKDSIPNNKELKKIERKDRKRKRVYLSLRIDNAVFISQKNESSFELFICNPIAYHRYIYQEYRLVNDFNEIYRIIIQFDKTLNKPISCCSNKILIYD